LKHN